jgi:hypothetical protein
MEFKRVGSVTMRDFCIEIRRKVDDVDCSKWTFLRTYTTAYRESHVIYHVPMLH